MFRWRAWLTGKEVDSQLESPVSLHPETVPFLYESFETALVDSFPQLGQELLVSFKHLVEGRIFIYKLEDFTDEAQADTGSHLLELVSVRHMSRVQNTCSVISLL